MIQFILYTRSYKAVIQVIEGNDTKSIILSQKVAILIIRGGSQMTTIQVYMAVIHII